MMQKSFNQKNPDWKIYVHKWIRYVLYKISISLLSNISTTFDVIIYSMTDNQLVLDNKSIKAQIT